MNVKHDNPELVIRCKRIDFDGQFVWQVCIDGNESFSLGEKFNNISQQGRFLQKTLKRFAPSMRIQLDGQYFGSAISTAWYYLKSGRLNIKEWFRVGHCHSKEMPYVKQV